MKVGCEALFLVTSRSRTVTRWLGKDQIKFEMCLPSLVWKTSCTRPICPASGAEGPHGTGGDQPELAELRVGAVGCFKNSTPQTAECSSVNSPSYSSLH